MPRELDIRRQFEDKAVLRAASREGSIVSSAMKPKELFAACKAKQEKFERRDSKKSALEAFQAVLFFRPLFWEHGSETAESERQYPLWFSVKAPVDPTVSEDGWRYRKLLELLSKMPDNNLRLLLLARWLAQEGICRPDEFLPQTTRHKVAKHLYKLSRHSPAEHRRYALVDIWRPYFESLLADLRKAPEKHNSPQKLRMLELGYDEKAIECSLQRKSPVSAACVWLGGRGAARWRNSYFGWRARRRRREPILSYYTP